MIRLVLAVVLFLYTCESILAQVALRQIKKGELEEAVARADEKVARLKKRNSRPENSPGLSQSKWEDKYIVEGLFEAAETYYYCGQFGKARELLEWCLVVYARDKPAETRKNNLCTLRLAETLIETGDYARAEQLTDQLKSKINLNPLSVEEAVEIKVRYSDIANVYQQIGRIAKANAVFEETLEFFLAKVNGKKTNKVVNSLVVTSDTYAFFEFYKRGSAALQYYTETAQYEKGEALAQTLVQLGEIKFGQDDYAYATVLDKQGELFLAMGRYDQALKIYLRCNDLANEAKKKSNLNYGWVNARLADCYFALGRYEDAKRHYQAASDIANDKSGMRADMLSTYVVIGLSSTLNRISAHSDALRVGLNGLDQYDKFSYQAKYWGEKRTELRFKTGLYTGIGVAYRGLKNYDSAQYFLQKAYDLQRGFPQFRAKTAMQMAELQAVVGHHEQAVALYKESLDTWLSFWDNNVFSLSENERSDFFASISEAMNSFTAYAVRKVGQTPTLIDDLYNYQLLTKGVLLNSSEKVRSRILGSGNSTLINAYNQWQSDRSLLIKVYQLSKEEISDRGIDVSQLEAKVEAQEKSLAQSSKYFQRAGKEPRYKRQDIQQKLRADEASVEIIRIQDPLIKDSVYYAAIMVRSGVVAPEMTIIQKGAKLETRFAVFYRNAVLSRLEDLLSYNVYWSSINKYLPNVKRVYLSPDGVYNQINLGIMMNPVTKRYLMDEIDIQLVTNSSDIIKRKGLPSKPGRVTMFGFPDYSGNDPIVSRDTAQLPEERRDLRAIFSGRIKELPGTEVELMSVSKLLTKQKIATISYMRMEATEEKVKSLKSPETLHFATHGFFLTDKDLTHNDSFIGFDREELAKNPLLRSGLMLAGAQKVIDGNVLTGREDGILTAQEAMTLELEGTNLVVLSACETGLGKTKNGEGVYGLQRAFLKAGAQAILMSFWVVDDQATQLLMTTFYDQWIKTGNKREAFRAAQKTIRTKYPHPFYWGAFVMIGE